ncbi:cuticle protein 21-like [Schistocerca gregaria]|uniref:cuticle protein 21-like n=1 Tax=Schistocerca gregaria TaxID=7010 RepID=UPI00211F04DE|nr:cuticle protein 21-like [Schistocerca gregaria]
MKILVLLSAVTAACVASPGFLAGGAAPLDAFRCDGAPCSLVGLPALSYAAPAPAGVVFPAGAPVALTSQFHAQDELGQYSYGYQGGPSAKSEARAFDGSVSGGYSYVDANGVLQTAQYVSDPVNGFRVAATNLPTATARPVEDTPEVMRARAAHAAFVADAAARSAALAAAATPAPAPAAAPEARDGQQAARTAPAPPASAATGRAAAPARPPSATSYANLVIGPSGVPLDTPEVAAARAADAVAHLQAKAAALFG